MSNSINRPGIRSLNGRLARLLPKRVPSTGVQEGEGEGRAVARKAAKPVAQLKGALAASATPNSAVGVGLLATIAFNPNTASPNGAQGLPGSSLAVEARDQRNGSGGLNSGGESNAGSSNNVGSNAGASTPGNVALATPTTPRLVPERANGRRLVEDLRSIEEYKQEMQAYLNTLPPGVDFVAGLGAGVFSAATDIGVAAYIAVFELEPHLLRRFANNPRAWEAWVKQHFGGWAGHNPLDPRRAIYDDLMANPPRYDPNNASVNAESAGRIVNAMVIEALSKFGRYVRDHGVINTGGRLFQMALDHVLKPLGENPNAGFAVASALVNLTDFVDGALVGAGLVKLAAKGVRIGAHGALDVLRSLNRHVLPEAVKLTEQLGRSADVADIARADKMKAAIKEMLEASKTEDAPRINRAKEELEGLMRAERERRAGRPAPETPRRRVDRERTERGGPRVPNPATTVNPVVVPSRVRTPEVPPVTPGSSDPLRRWTDPSRTPNGTNPRQANNPPPLIPPGGGTQPLPSGGGDIPNPNTPQFNPGGNPRNTQNRTGHGNYPDNGGVSRHDETPPIENRNPQRPATVENRNGPSSNRNQPQPVAHPVVRNVAQLGPGGYLHQANIPRPVVEHLLTHLNGSGFEDLRPGARQGSGTNTKYDVLGIRNGRAVEIVGRVEGNRFTPTEKFKQQFPEFPARSTTTGATASESTNPVRQRPGSPGTPSNYATQAKAIREAFGVTGQGALETKVIANLIDKVETTARQGSVSFDQALTQLWGSAGDSAKARTLSEAIIHVRTNSNGLSAQDATQIQEAVNILLDVAPEGAKLQTVQRLLNFGDWRKFAEIAQSERVPVRSVGGSSPPEDTWGTGNDRVRTGISEWSRSSTSANDGSGGGPGGPPRRLAPPGAGEPGDNPENLRINPQITSAMGLFNEDFYVARIVDPNTRRASELPPGSYRRLPEDDPIDRYYYRVPGTDVTSPEMGRPGEIVVSDSNVPSQYWKSAIVDQTTGTSLTTATPYVRVRPVDPAQLHNPAFGRMIRDHPQIASARLFLWAENPVARYVRIRIPQGDGWVERTFDEIHRLQNKPTIHSASVLRPDPHCIVLPVGSSVLIPDKPTMPGASQSGASGTWITF